MKVQVDPQRCQGHTLYAVIAPKVFRPNTTTLRSAAVMAQPTDLLESRAAPERPAVGDSATRHAGYVPMC